MTPEEETNVIDELLYAADNSTFAPNDDLRRNDMRLALSKYRVMLIDRVEYLNLRMDADAADSRGSMTVIGFIVVGLFSAAMASVITAQVL